MAGSGTQAVQSRPRVVVAIPTFRRPEGLARVLPVVVEQAVDSPFHPRVVVIDNDPDGRAGDFVRAWSDHGVRYAHEPVPGIAAARNRALDEAVDDDVLVFIDDDEVPEAHWLDEHLSAWRRWRCAAVVGPVVPWFETEPDAWVRGSGVFTTVQRPSGMVLSGGASNNLLLDLRQLRSEGLRFDEQFGLTGGEDTKLTHGLVRSGRIVRWCAEARVTEYVPAERLTRQWVIKRRLRTSNTWSRVALDLAGSPSRRMVKRADLTMHSAVCLVRGVAGGLWAAARRDDCARARAGVEIVNAVGMLLGAYGYVSSEYCRKPAGVAGPSNDGSGSPRGAERTGGLQPTDTSASAVRNS